MMGVPDSNISKLQRIQNTLARVDTAVTSVNT